MTKTRGFFARLALGAGLICVTVLAVPNPAQAATIFTLGGADFSGPTDNTGGTIRVTIEDVAGGVTLQIDNNMADFGSFLETLYLNTTVAPLSGPAGSCLSGDCASVQQFKFGNSTTTPPGFNADGSGYYDILIDFQTRSSLRFNAGESVMLQILSSSAGFNAASFLTTSNPGGGNGSFQAAAHVQGLPPNGDQSDFIAARPEVPGAPIPEPGSMLLLGSGLAFAARAMRRKRAS